MRTLRLLVAGCAVCFAVGFGQPLVSGPVVVFLGPPGSGKTAQAAIAAKYLKVPVVSVSDLVGENAAALAEARTPGITGMEPETDPLLNKFFEARLNRGDVCNGMVLDGYPNTKDQADFSSKMVAAGLISKPLILRFQVPDEVVRKRVAGKNGKLPPSVEQRLKDYRRETTAVEIYFPNADIVDIDATVDPSFVTDKVKAVLKAKFGK